MTESQWLTCTDPTPMLEFLRGKASDRKLRLFAAGCCRLVWHLLPREASKKAIELLEQLADRPMSEQMRAEGHAAAYQAAGDIGAAYRESRRDTEPSATDYQTVWKHLRAANAVTLSLVSNALEAAIGGSTRVAMATAIERHGNVDDANRLMQVLREESVPHARLLVDIFGPFPFRPVTLSPLLLTSSVTNLAQAIYDERAWDRLPILADALEEAGCDNDEVLAHCRAATPHVRGCWVVDLVLGKS